MGSMHTSAPARSATAQPSAPTVVEPVVTPTEPGDHDRFAHYVPKQKLTEAMVHGTPVRALCGKYWVPSRDPDKYPICPECKAIYEGMKAGGSSGSD